MVFIVLNELIEVGTNHFFRVILFIICVFPLSDTHCDKADMLENYLSLLTTTLQERTFLIDYNTKHNLSDDFLIFEQVGTTHCIL